MQLLIKRALSTSDTQVEVTNELSELNRGTLRLAQAVVKNRQSLKITI